MKRQGLGLSQGGLRRRLKKHISKNKLYALLSKLTPTVNGLITVLVIIRTIPRYEFGLLTLFNTFDLVIFALSGGLVFQALQKYGAELKGIELETMVSNSAFLYGLLSLGPALLIAAVGTFLAETLNADGLANLLGLLPVVVVSQWGRKFAYHLLLAKEQVFQVFVVDLVALIVTAALVLGLYFTGQLDSARVVLFVRILANAVAAIVSVVLIKNIVKLSWRPDRVWRKKLLNFGKYTFGTTVGNIIYTRIDTVMLTYFFNPVALALFHSARGIAEFAKNVVQAANMIILPRASTMSSQKDKRGVKDIYFKGLFYSVALALPISLALLILPELILKLAYNGKYKDGVNILRIFALVALVGPLGTIGSSIASGVGKPRLTFITMSLGVVINIVLNLLLIPTHGAMGAAVATLITVAFGGVLITILLKRRLGLAPIPARKSHTWLARNLTK